ncbi:MAG: hydroxyisourate hydrolase [Terracidiphilus sp.]|jgi:5-hydroxyisourate hydrolase
MSAITTHVLDTVLGKPAAGIAVRLEKLDGGGWIEVLDTPGMDSEPPERVRDAPCSWVEVAAGATDADGRCRDLAADAPAGDYRLTFDTGSYLKRQGRTGIYPEISITFTCDGKGHYHLPLLLSDNSYTTYRGS